MKLFIGLRPAIEVASFEEASAAYCKARDESGAGAREFPNGRLMPGHFISYNGKVWAGTEYVEGAEPVYSPYGRPRQVLPASMPSPAEKIAPVRPSKPRVRPPSLRKAAADFLKFLATFDGPQVMKELDQFCPEYQALRDAIAREERRREPRQPIEVRHAC
jgi:hypothetical protein